MSRKIFLLSTFIVISAVYINEIKEIPDEFEIFMLGVMLVSGMSFCKSFSRNFSLAVLALSAVLTYLYDIGIDSYIFGIKKNLPLVILFVLVPFLSIPIRKGGYLKSFNAFIIRISDRPNLLFGVISFFVFLVGSVANLASVRIINDMLDEIELPRKLLVKSYAAGFAACMAWSPYFAGVTLAVGYGGFNFKEFIPTGLGFALIILALGNLVFLAGAKYRKSLKGQLNHKENCQVEETENKSKQIVLVLNFIVLFLAVIFGEQYISFSSTMYLIGLIAVVYGLVWLARVSAGWESFLEEAASHREKILQTVNEIVFFLSIGILGGVIGKTPAKEFVGSIFDAAADLNSFVKVEMIILTIVFFAVAGVHQIVSITVLGEILSPDLIGISNIAYTFIFISSWMISAIASPFGPFNMVMAGIVDRSVFKVSFGYNRSLSLLLVVASGIFIWSLG